MTTSARSKRSGADVASDPPLRRVRLWDPALRVFHWLLAFLVIATWLLAKFGPKVMTLHFWCGYAIIVLLAFRILWGVIGPPEARFVHFIHGPRATLRYMRGFVTREPSYWHGHNPMGGWSVVAMIVLLVAQVGTGLISDPDDYINVGPLASRVASSTSSSAVGWHHLGGTLILILVVIHVATVLWYRLWKREDLIRPMITGWKLVRRRQD